MSFRKTNYKEIFKKITKLDKKRIETKNTSLIFATKLPNGTYEVQETLSSGKTKEFILQTEEELERYSEEKKGTDCLFVIDDILSGGDPIIMESITKECSNEELKTIIEEIEKEELGEIQGTPLTDKIIIEKAKQMGKTQK